MLVGFPRSTKSSEYSTDFPVAAATACAVSPALRNGLAMSASNGSLDARSAIRSACPLPFSFSGESGDWKTGATLSALSPWRTKYTVFWILKLIIIGELPDAKEPGSSVLVIEPCAEYVKLLAD